MATPEDVPFGRLLLARRLVPEALLRQVYGSLPPDRSLRDELVGRGALDPRVADALQRELAPRPRPGALPEVGELVDGRYEVRSVLGRGGMGAVFRALDRVRGEDVAIKLLLGEPGGGPGEGRALDRFRREAEAIAKVDAHQRVVRVRALGRHGALPYAVLDLIEGGDLRAHVKEHGPFDPEEAARLVEEVARAIQHCHERGVLHRDLKPANVLLRASDGQPFVTDFGLALDEAGSRLTRTGELLGTPAYMAPEQAEGGREAIDARADVYGLGATLYELVSGRPPFTGARLHLLKQVLLDAPAPLATHRPRAPADLNAICQKALAKEPAARYSSAGALADDLARFRRGEPVGARAPSRWELLRWRLRRRDPRALGAVAALAVSILVLGGAGAFGLRELILRQPAGDPRQERLDAAIAALDGLRDYDPLLRDEADGPCPALTQAQAVFDASSSLLELDRDEQSLSDEQRPFGLWARRIERLAGGEGQAGETRGALELARSARLHRLADWLWLKDGPAPKEGPAPERDPDDRALQAALAGLGWRAQYVELSEGRVTATIAALTSLSAAKGAVGACAADLLRGVARVDAVVDAYLAAGVNELGRAVLPQPPWGGLSQLDAPLAAALRELRLELGPLQAFLVARLRLKKPAAAASAIEAVTTRLGALSALDSKSALELRTLAQHVLETLLGEKAAPAPAPDGLFDPVLRLIADRAAASQIERAAEGHLMFVVDGVAAHVRWARFRHAKDRKRATALQRLLMFGSVEQFALGRDQLPPIERMMLVPRLEVDLPLSRHMVDRIEGYLRRDAFKRYAEERAEGDAYLLWARALEMVAHVDTRDEARVSERARELYAHALGEALSAAERQALGLGEPIPLRRPLTPFWEVFARVHLLDRVFDQDDPQVRVSAARALVALRPRMDESYPDSRFTYYRNAKELDPLLPVYAGIAPESRAFLAEQHRALLEQGIAFGWSLLRHGGEPSNASAALTSEGSPQTVQNNVTRLVGFLVRHLFDAREPDEALRRIEATHERVVALTGAPDLDFLNDSARMALMAGQDEAAARLSERVRAEVRARPDAGRERARDRKGHAARALSLLAELRLRAGDLDAVQALWEETQALGVDQRAEAWPPLLERLAAARRERQTEGPQ